jgi:heme exporter protein C
MANLHWLANPGRFLLIAKVVSPVLAVLTAGLLGIGLVMSLPAPVDAVQGTPSKVLYMHVPSAWMSMFIWGSMAVASGVALIWKHPLADIAAKASAPIGAGFTAATLFTGSLWGKPTWGTFWVWDARLTAELILLFLYVGYIAIWQAIEDPQRAGKAAAILALVGSINLPIIHFSVEWWNTLHQPASLLREGGSSIDSSMLIPLLLLAAGFQTFYFMLVLWRMEAEIAGRKIRQLRLLSAQA